MESLIEFRELFDGHSVCLYMFELSQIELRATKWMQAVNLRCSNMEKWQAVRTPHGIRHMHKTTHIKHN